MRRVARLSLILVAFFTLPGLTSESYSDAGSPSMVQFQPSDERAAQDALPKSKNPLWKTLGKTKIAFNNKNGNYIATFPEAVKKLNGQSVTINGFMLPLEATPKFKHFLISKRTPTCPFCPPGEPNEIVEVYTAKPVGYTENLVTCEGQFKLLSNKKENGIFFQLANAAEKE